MTKPKIVAELCNRCGTMHGMVPGEIATRCAAVQSVKYETKEFAEDRYGSAVVEIVYFPPDPPLRAVDVSDQKIGGAFDAQAQAIREYLNVKAKAIDDLMDESHV